MEGFAKKYFPLKRENENFWLFNNRTELKASPTYRHTPKP